VQRQQATTVVHSLNLVYLAAVTWSTHLSIFNLQYSGA